LLLKLGHDICSANVSGAIICLVGGGCGRRLDCVGDNDPVSGAIICLVGGGCVRRLDCVGDNDPTLLNLNRSRT